jgi:hypothetical protein
MSIASPFDMRRLLVLVFLLLPSASAAQGIVNDCADPAWRNTLRCQVAPTPYTSLGPPTDVKAFTRVFLLGDPAVRCFDGTAPTIYVDKAVDSSGRPVESGKWLFTLQGGGSCMPVDTDGDGAVDDVSECLTHYLGGEAAEMSSGDSKAMKNYFGIHSADPVKNPVFAGYNRVRIDKCSFDRYNGRASWTALRGAGVAGSFDVYQLGYPIITQALAELLPGLTYRTWRNAGGIRAVEETLPPLSAATTILFVGHSGAAQGLIHNIDHLAADLAARAVTADVRALIDAHFTLSQENEAAFIGAGDLYDHIWTGTTSGAGSVFSYDSSYWSPGGAYREQYTSWNAQVDASCRAAHPTDSFPCFDSIHVLLNHVATPFFMREDFTDSNHSNRAEDHVLAWGPRALYPHCGATPCPPKFTVPAEHHPRLDEQADRLWYDLDARSELAVNLDSSLGGVGLTPSFAMWMPDCGVHEGAYDDRQFFAVTIDHASGSRSMRSLLESFMGMPRTGARSMYRDHFVDSGGHVSQTSGCR